MPFDPTQALTVTIGGIKCWSEDHSAHLSLRGDSTATVTLLCKYNDRMALAIALMGGVIAPGVTQVGLSYPDAQWLGVSEIDITGVDGENGATPGNAWLRAYDYARLVVSFAPPTSAPLGGSSDPDLIELDYSAQILSLPRDRATYQFDDGTQLPPEASPGLVDPITEILMPRSGLSDNPNALVSSLEGKVNQGSFLGSAEATILFNGARSKPRFVTSQLIVWDAVYSLSRRVRGWNKFFNPSTQLFEDIVGIDSGNPPYELASFSALLL